MVSTNWGKPSKSSTDFGKESKSSTAFSKPAGVDTDWNPGGTEAFAYLLLETGGVILKEDTYGLLLDVDPSQPNLITNPTDWEESGGNATNWGKVAVNP